MAFFTRQGRMNVQAGYERYCIKQRTVRYTNPVTKATYNVLQCWNCEADGIDCEWEFANNHEWDGTDDGSYWTSIETDNILATSPSPVVALQAAEPIPHAEEVMLRDGDEEIDNVDQDDFEDSPVTEFTEPDYHDHI
jgi:hypothetical protein